VPFKGRRDYETFFRALQEACKRFPMRILAYAVMPNHWHFVLWPPDDETLSRFMKWLTAAHAQQWRQSTNSRGRGAVYQGRYKAIAIQQDGHFLQVCRYVERNPVRAKLVARAEDWPWSSAARLSSRYNRPALAEWPVPRPANWYEQLNAPESPGQLQSLRTAIQQGRHFGSLSWKFQTNGELEWRSGARGPGRHWAAVETTDPELPVRAKRQNRKSAETSSIIRPDP
jgi:putative transposase